MTKKRIAYVTGSRAEYGIVKRLLRRLQEDNELDFSLIVTAMHLAPQYGNTVDVIEQDGFNIAKITNRFLLQWLKPSIYLENIFIKIIMMQ